MVIDKEQAPDFKVIKVTKTLIVVSSQTFDQIHICQRSAAIVFASIRSRFDIRGKSIYCVDSAKDRIKCVLQIVSDKAGIKAVRESCPQTITYLAKEF